MSAQDPTPGEETVEEDPAAIIEHPVTGERIKFLDPPEVSSGEVLRFELWARANTVGPGAHIHPKQEEYFEVLEGTLSARVGKKDMTLTESENVTVPKGTPHAWWNSSDEELHIYVEVRPSMDMRDSFEALFALGRIGRTNDRGMPNILQTSVVLTEYPDMIYLAGLPIPLQKICLRMLAPIARQLGYKARYPELVGASE